MDGCAAFCEIAHKHTCCPVLQQTFLRLDLSPQSFDGIFANASLFHVPSVELPRVLYDLSAALRPNGVLFLSIPRGSGEGWSGDRYGHYLQIESCSAYLVAAGFEVLDNYYRPAGKPLYEQPWLAVVAAKPTDATY